MGTALLIGYLLFESGGGWEPGPIEKIQEEPPASDAAAEGEIQDKRDNRSAEYNFSINFKDAKLEMGEKKTDSFGYRLSDQRGNFLKVTLLEEKGPGVNNPEAVSPDSPKKQWVMEEDGIVAFTDAAAVKFITRQDGKIGVKYILRASPLRPLFVFSTEMSNGLSFKQEQKSSKSGGALDTEQTPDRKEADAKQQPDNIPTNIVDKDGKIIFQILTPVFYDVKGKGGFAALTVSGEKFLMISLNQVFLIKAVYPIVISTAIHYDLK